MSAFVQYVDIRGGISSLRCLLILLQAPHSPPTLPLPRSLRRPRTNTILLGAEIGAFKAANASYLLSGSYAVRQGAPYVDLG